ncbi:hypothetical protein CK203_021808 [Vitis vinifera]|uniref:DUF4283 domain-containing protein n=1 Tax=Vitis vinifera TaxID=29760 RepID=A0A438JFR9_VITVI|nr:hypothetical protein CK203_021808 [Vitis vinifera]
MSYVPAFEQATDLLTEGLGRPMFEKLVNGVVSCIAVGDMLLRERVRECESEGEGDGDEGDNQTEKRRKRQGKSFGVESKVFEVEVEKRRVRQGWERGQMGEGLEKKGRSYSMVREVNKVGSFIWLGVVDAEEKRYSICIPRGRGERGGWSTMAEVVRDLITRLDRREEKKEESIPVRLQAEMGGENLARLGWLMASAWGLKGKLDLAWLEEGQALLEFELVEEARKVFAAGKRSVGGIQVGLKLWSPSYGCLEEGEIREEVWVRIMGLPISLWVPSILRRVGDECSGFVAMDPSTEKWKTSSGLGSWEVLPSIRQKLEGYRGSTDRARGEVRGDRGSRTGPRVEKWGSARLEALSWTTDGMEGQVDRTGRVLTAGQIQFRSMIRPSVGGAEDGPSLFGLTENTLA